MTRMTRRDFAKGMVDIGAAAALERCADETARFSVIAPSVIDAWAQRFDVTVGLHDHWLGETWFQGDRAANFETRDDFKRALAGRSAHDPVAFFARRHARINSLHLEDRDDDRDHAHRRFGRGVTPLAEVLRLVRRVGLPHAANIEYEVEEHDPTEGVRTAVQYIRRVLLDDGEAAR